MKENVNWVQQLKISADAAAESDAKGKKEQVLGVSEKVIDRMAHEYEWSRSVVEAVNTSIRDRLHAYQFSPGKDYISQLREAAIRVFQEAVDRAFRNSAGDIPQRLFERLAKEYEEQLREG